MSERIYSPFPGGVPTPVNPIAGMSYRASTPSDPGHSTDEYGEGADEDAVAETIGREPAGGRGAEDENERQGTKNFGGKQAEPFKKKDGKDDDERGRERLGVDT